MFICIHYRQSQSSILAFVLQCLNRSFIVEKGIVMFIKEWEILVVDDDEDVLQITALALKDVRVNGAPLKIHTARSKAEALDLIHTKLLPKGGFSTIHVALIDVVMETDTAGLEL